MSDLKLALTYAPRILFDRAEPFTVDGIGYTVLRQSGPSPSFRRHIELAPGMAFCMEYAVYFDYDIQHLYDLEHIWVFVDHAGQVCDVQASFHGRYMNALLPQFPGLLAGTHMSLYCQPGKHAFLPDGQLFRLLPDWQRACNEAAGDAGLLVMGLFADQLAATPQMQQQVARYIRSRYSFTPTLEFEPRPLDDALMMTWERLKALIPVRVQRQLDVIAAQA